MTGFTRAVLIIGAAAAVGIGALAPTQAQDKDKKKRGGTLTFEVYKDAGESFRWRLKAANGQIIGASGAGYKAKADCLHAIDVIKSGAATANVKEAMEADK
jgi:uncharacterized protein YegP (UPF0339 family)